jgi:predicted nuclease of restriction endonuclease-like RecB superfamily
MLTPALVRLRSVKNRLVPQFLDASLESWRNLADQMLDLFREANGRSYGELESDAEDIASAHPARIVAQGLAKVLEDRCEFEVVAGHPPEEIRERVFLLAEQHRRNGTLERAAVLQLVATELGCAVDAVEAGLFADLKSEQRLKQFEDTTTTRLIERYNVGLAQAILLRATSVSVTLRNEPPARFRRLFRAIKFHRLVVEVEQPSPGIVVLRLDGPMSLFSATQRYGLQLANFLPHVLQSRQFDLRAEVLWGTQKKEKLLVLSNQDGLVSHVADTASYVPPEMQMFADLFRKKCPEWTLEEETEVLPLGRGFWVPDFRLTHRMLGGVVYMEMLGFWRRSSAEAHLRNLRKHAQTPFLLAVSDQLKIDEAELEGMPAEIVRYRQMPLPDEVSRLALAALTQ